MIDKPQPMHNGQDGVSRKFSVDDLLHEILGFIVNTAQMYC